MCDSGEFHHNFLHRAAEHHSLTQDKVSFSQPLSVQVTVHALQAVRFLHILLLTQNSLLVPVQLTSVLNDAGPS